MIQKLKSYNHIENYIYLFICPEFTFSQQLAKNIKIILFRHYLEIWSFNGYVYQIIYEFLLFQEELQKCVSERLPNIIRQHPIGLVVVDSVAAIFRSDYSSTEALKRARDMRSFASRLHFLAHTHNIAVVCVNQVKHDIYGLT